MQVSGFRSVALTVVDYVLMIFTAGFFVKWLSTGRFPNVVDLSGDASHVLAVILAYLAVH